MPFLAAAIPAIISATATAGVGAIGSALANGRPKGSEFQAQSANVVNPVTGQQAQQAVGQAQQGIGQQQNFVNALAGQNGIQNQSSVFNQLQNVANGQGPNPAQAMLAQQTGNNVANQAALMAGQRGAGANIGLLARQAAQQGGALQQNAAGQAATLQANQSLGALGQLGGIAGQQVGQQQQGLQNLTGLQQNQQQALLGQINSQNNANISNVQQQNAANAGISNNNANIVNSNAKDANTAVGAAVNALGGTLASQVGGAMSPKAAPTTSGGMNKDAFSAAHGLAQGGEVPSQQGPQANMKENYKGRSKIGSHLSNFSKGGKVPAMVSPGEVYLDRKDVKEVKSGKDPIKAGEKIKGKASVKGDSLKNDIIAKKLESGGIVIPRSITQGPDAHEKAHRFVSAVLAKQGKK